MSYLYLIVPSHPHHTIAVQDLGQPFLCHSSLLWVAILHLTNSKEVLWFTQVELNSDINTYISHLNAHF